MSSGVIYVQKILDRLDKDSTRSVISFNGVRFNGWTIRSHINAGVALLRERGVNKGDLVAIACSNTLAGPILRYATHILGAVAYVVPLLESGDFIQLLQQIDPDWILAFPEVYDWVPHLSSDLANKLISCPIRIELDDPATVTHHTQARIEAELDDIGVLLSSGGTSGLPKASLRTFKQYTDVVGSVPMSSQRKELIHGPLANLSLVLFDAVLAGGGFVVLVDCYDPSINRYVMDVPQLLRSIELERITNILLVQPQLWAFMDHPMLQQTDLSSLVTISTMGDLAPPTLISRAIKRLGPRVRWIYGGSEMGVCSSITFDIRSSNDSLPGGQLWTCGKLRPGIEMRLRPLNREIGESNDVTSKWGLGLVSVRHSGVALGYRKQPGDRSFANDGWYHSQDVVYLDAEENLSVMGRNVDVEIPEGDELPNAGAHRWSMPDNGVSRFRPDGILCALTMSNSLCLHGDIQHAAVFRDCKNKRWICGLVLWPASSWQPGAYLDCLHNSFPSSTIRAVFRQFAELPLTSQGKVDRKRIFSAMGDESKDSAPVFQQQRVILE